MDWTDELILLNFKGIVEDSISLSSKELETKYNVFKSKFEKIYQMAIENPDITKLEMMLSARKSFKSGRMKKIDVEMLVGNKLGKEYIYPKVENPTQQDYNRAVKKIKEGKAINELEKSTNTT